MKKVYESYCLNKKSFYLIFLIYIEEQEDEDKESDRIN